MGTSDMDQQIEQLRRCEPLAEVELKARCLKAMEILDEESNVQHVNAPVTVRAHAQLPLPLLLDWKRYGHANMSPLRFLAAVRLSSRRIRGVAAFAHVESIKIQSYFRPKSLFLLACSCSSHVRPAPMKKQSRPKECHHNHLFLPSPPLASPLSADLTGVASSSSRSVPPARIRARAPLPLGDFFFGGWVSLPMGGNIAVAGALCSTLIDVSQKTQRATNI
ncbi:hypothetical protein ZWY2020_014532 [Hordeum vulgare]|nr:hypothetical protein ZWY2020_014532 [Hordeum vulgare]